MGLLKKIGKALFPGTGRHAAKRAKKEAEKLVAEAQAMQVENERKTKRERQRAQKLALRGLRSKRSAGFFRPVDTGTSGSTTIG